MNSGLAGVLARWVARLKNAGGKPNDLVALLPDPPGQWILTLRGLEVLAACMACYTEAEIQAMQMTQSPPDTASKV